MPDAQLTGVLIGGGIAVATTAANLLYNWAQKRSEQRSQFRQSVYLEACEGIEKAHEFLVSLGNIDLDDKQLYEGMRASAGWSSKVHIVASEDTIRALTAASEFLFAAALELLPLRVAARLLSSEVDEWETRAKQAEQQHTQLTALTQRSSNENATPPVLAQLGELREESRAAREQHAKLAEQSLVVQEKLFLAAMKAATEYGQRLIAVNVAVRRELGLAISEESYRTVMTESSRRMLSSCESVLKLVKERDDGVTDRTLTTRAE